MQKIVRIILVVTTCLVIGYLSGIVTRESITTWYPTLVKPFFNPPNWLFAPVWTILYIMMGVAGGMIWNQLETDQEKVKKAFTFFVIQLALNALWSYLFFGLHNPLLALIEIIILWLVIFETYTQFKQINTTAAFLLLPYLAWVSFAFILNASIWWLNS
ncbi:MAG: TspO/MBR family protein [Bacteroidota bacterium]